MTDFERVLGTIVFAIMAGCALGILYWCWEQIVMLRAKFKTLKSSEQDAARWMLQAMVQLQERLDALESEEEREQEFEKQMGELIRGLRQS